MKDFIIDFDNNAGANLYEQIYERFRTDIESGVMPRGVKMPSLRMLAASNGISITTVETAYNQLLVEGYIVSRPKSGYYVSDDISPVADTGDAKGDEFCETDCARDQQLLFDEESFDFSRWKKSMNKVFNTYSHLLRTEAEIQGESMLRSEIAQYLYSARGVRCHPRQIVVGAGSQQITTLLTKIFQKVGISNAAIETPGYGPIREIFKDEGFSMHMVPVDEKGIEIEELPLIRSVIYVSPSNQYPTGSVMPVARRYELIRWAEDNDSYVLEDDYDSELRYFGKPVPAMKSLGSGERIIYLGSFSSTLFAGIRISYVVLPDALTEPWNYISDKYDQGCSKTEQLCLAIYMQEGYYVKGIKKCRKLYASKLQGTIGAFREHGGDLISTVDSKSGLAITLRIRTTVPAADLCKAARRLGLLMNPVDDLCTDDEQVLCFYFYRVSETMLKILIKQYITSIRRYVERR